ncbi:F-box only protein 5-like [Adelges cooleyi]|uniref:F-box only protein 5-like n=1 Tax=Adelges cooleyi TaxID=133065 RepID=UPI0021802162|nr:F-box only protein 5-like [Adelges cooleyi]
MADLSMKESPCYDKCMPFLCTSTPYKIINDSGYDTPSSTLTNASSNYSHEASMSFDQTLSSDFATTQFSLCTPSFSQKRSIKKLEDITNKTDCTVKNKFIEEEPPSVTELSPSKKFKSSSDLRMRFRINKCPKQDDHLQKKKNIDSPKIVSHERASLEGRDHVDIMYFLAERNHFGLVVEKIFSYLSDSDIVPVSMVSKIWNNAVQNSPTAQSKRQIYFKLSKENRGCEGRNRAAMINKGCLSNIGNVMRSPTKRDLTPRSPPVSPSKYRWHVFQKEAKKLNPDQRLIRCPLCTMPSSWTPTQSTRAQCHRIHCRYTFCTSCMCEYTVVPVHKCRSTPISSHARQTLITSMSRSKHNLRRLL